MAGRQLVHAGRKVAEEAACLVECIFLGFGVAPAPYYYAPPPVIYAPPRVAYVSPAPFSLGRAVGPNCREDTAILAMSDWLEANASSSGTRVSAN